MQRCSSCTRETGIGEAHTACPHCGGILDIEHHLPAAQATQLRALFDGRARLNGTGVSVHERSGVWRYGEIVYPDAPHPLTFPEGNTPLIARAGVSAWCDAPNLLMKHEGMNPTGSFKDRGMCVAVTQARRVNASAVVCASTGNTSSSLAAYAGVAGIPAFVLVPAGRVATGKLAQTQAYGARVLLVRGNFDDCLRLTREASQHLGAYLVNSLNPFRIEGQKTIVLELLQQLGWNAPDWIVLPAGNLGNASAFGKAIREAVQLGLISRTPRLLLVQASGAAPFARSFRDGFRTRVPMQPDTMATAIRIGDPASFDRAVASVKYTDGIVMDVSDAEIVAAKTAVDTNGVGCEPASAATIAGIRALVRNGAMHREASVVAVLTGHLLKDPLPESGDAQLRSLRPPMEIGATLSAVEQALRTELP